MKFDEFHFSWRMTGRALGAFLLATSVLLSLSAHAGSAAYKYDNLGRLNEISYDTGVVVKYSYDAAGNRTTELITGTGVLSPEAKSALIIILMQLLLED